jgi:ABC-type spermidine/putrescine transport system permease subunit I
VITAAQPAAAIILYSTSATHCNLSTNDQAEAYRYIFTFKDSTAVAALNQTLTTAANKTATIVPMSYPTTTTVDTSASGTGDSPNTGALLIPPVLLMS